MIVGLAMTMTPILRSSQMDNALVPLLLLSALPVAHAAYEMGWYAGDMLKAPKPRNYVILLADDTGYGDFGATGHPTIQTPHVDRLYREGLRLSRWYSPNPICSPARGSLMTGRYCSRWGGDHNGNAQGVFEPYMSGGLPPNETTLANLASAAGIRTAAVGKWHLGINAENATDCRYCPTQSGGFDHFFGSPFSNCGGCKEGSFKEMQSRSFLYANATIMEQPIDYTNLSNRFADFAVDFIETSVRAEERFFLYYSFFHNHVDLFASPPYANRSLRGAYGDNVEEMDGEIGAVLAALDRLGVSEETLVMFTSDNGAWRSEQLWGGSNGLFKAGKLQTWEGGIREPGVAWWPGVVKPGSRSSIAVNSIDMWHTLADFEDSNIDGVPRDGTSLRPLLLGECSEELRTRPMFHYIGTTVQAASLGPYKAHWHTQDCSGSSRPAVACADGGNSKAWDPPLLFNVEEDPAEEFPLCAPYCHGQVVMDGTKEAACPGHTSLPASECGALRDRFEAAKAAHLEGLWYPPTQQKGNETALIPCCNPPACCCGPACVPPNKATYVSYNYL